MELNAEQRAVVDSLQENILLTASAGTGKTNTMAARIARVVEQGLARPEEILCLTFTNKASSRICEGAVTSVSWFAHLFTQHCTSEQLAYMVQSP